jgi:hypothetical protein
MSNRFNLSQFTTALNTLTCSREDKPSVYAAFIADALRDSAQDWLLEGSDALTQVLAKFENAGKSAVAVKFRKIIRGCGASLLPYGEIEGLTLVKNKFPGGNGESGRKDHENRTLVCESFREKVFAYAQFVFSPAVSDGVADPLSAFGAFSEKSFAIKIASANIEQIECAVKRTLVLTALLASALESAKKQNADESAPAPEASAPEASAPEASAPEASAPAPEASAPEASAPAPAPEASAPAPAPEASAPEASAPEASAPAPAKTRRTISVKRKLVA